MTDYIAIARAAAGEAARASWFAPGQCRDGGFCSAMPCFCAQKAADAAIAAFLSADGVDGHLAGARDIASAVKGYAAYE